MFHFCYLRDEIIRVMFKRHKKVNQYKIDNEAFLVRKAEEEGVVALESGVLVQSSAEGHGKVHPKPGSLVYVHYTGRLIDGTQFDTSAGENLPALFQVRNLIMGWQIVLTRMVEGEKCRVWIPAKYGYGGVKMDGIPAWSALEFDIELVKIAQL